MDINSIIPIASPVLCGVIIYYAQRRQNKRDAAAVEQQNTQAEANFHLLKSVKSIGKLSYANAVAIKEGKVNGVMSEAMDYYKQNSDELETFLQQQTAENMAK